MKILSLDLSTTQTGYCVANNGAVALFGKIKPPSKLKAFERSIETTKQLAELITKEKPDEIVIEATYMAFPESAMLLGKLHGMVAWIWYTISGKVPTYIEATHVRKVVGLEHLPRGPQLKKVIINYVQHIGFPDVDNDDTADAILLALCYIKEHPDGRESQSQS